MQQWWKSPVVVPWVVLGTFWHWTHLPLKSRRAKSGETTCWSRNFEFWTYTYINPWKRACFLISQVIVIVSCITLTKMPPKQKPLSTAQIEAMLEMVRFRGRLWWYLWARSWIRGGRRSWSSRFNLQWTSSINLCWSSDI